MLLAPFVYGWPMEKIAGVAQDTAGNVIPSTSVTVYIGTGNTLATIYSDAAFTALTNPFTSLTDGTYTFYAQDGRYSIILSKSGYTFPAIQTNDFIISDRSSTLAPAVLGANQNDYAPSNGLAASTWLLSASTPINITGIVAGREGQLLTLINTGTQTITLIQSSGSSAATNRFDLATGANFALAQRDVIVLQYVTISGTGAWRHLSDNHVPAAANTSGVGSAVIRFSGSQLVTAAQSGTQEFTFTHNLGDMSYVPLFWFNPVSNTKSGALFICSGLSYNDTANNPDSSAAVGVTVRINPNTTVIRVPTGFPYGSGRTSYGVSAEWDIASGMLARYSSGYLGVECYGTINTLPTLGPQATNTFTNQTVGAAESGAIVTSTITPTATSNTLFITLLIGYTAFAAGNGCIAKILLDGASVAIKDIEHVNNTDQVAVSALVNGVNNTAHNVTATIQKGSYTQGATMAGSLRIAAFPA